MAQDVGEAANGAAPRERAHDARTNDIRKTEEKRTHGLADEEQRRRDHGEENVLEHVDAEQIRGDVLERRYQREQQRRGAEEEGSRAPHRPPPALHPAHAARIRRRREDGSDDG
jgi:hypothetical protein